MWHPVEDIYQQSGWLGHPESLIHTLPGRCLLKMGADHTIADKYGVTLWKNNENWNRQDVLEMLEEFGITE